MMNCEAISKASLAFFIIKIVLAVIILLVLSFTKKRARLCPKALNGVPGLITPVNLLRFTSNRLMNAVVFASMSSTIVVNFFLSPSLGSVNNEYGQVFIDVLTTWFWVLFQAVTYLPLFGCFNAPIQWLGMLMGATHSSVMLTSALLNAVNSTCPQLSPTVIDSLAIGVDVPIYISLFILQVNYIVRFILEVQKRQRSCRLDNRIQDEDDYYRKWVKDLLNYKRAEGNEQSKNTFESWNFKFSPRFISTIFMLFVIIYQLTLLWIGWLYFTTTIISDFVSKLGLFSNNTVQMISSGLTAGAVIAPCITSIIELGIVIFMMIKIRADLKRVIHGDFSSFHIPNPLAKDNKFNIAIPTPDNILASSLNYMSYQVGYLITSWLIVLIAVMGAGAAAVAIIGALIFVTTWILPKIISLVLSIIISIIVWQVQKCTCKHVFTDKFYERSENQLAAKGTAIAHVQLYHWWTYMFFFFNTFRGIFSSLLRALISIVIVMLLLVRMDRNIYIRGWESYDGAYCTYVANLYLEYSQNNPIVNTFVQILHQRVLHGHKIDPPMNDDISDKSYQDTGCFRVSRKALNRWKLAIILLRNPSIRDTRKVVHIDDTQNVDDTQNAPPITTIQSEPDNSKERVD